MSTTIDERVVSMQFDNRHFEKNVATSISTIDKLKQKLNFKDSAKSLDTISDAAGKVDMSTLSDSADKVSSKFSALEVIGITALANITNSAVNTGKQLIKSLSVDQLSAGWTKYEQKTSSIQTIMNSTGKSIDQVNNYLDKLMWYSDETSYGFTDMTQSLAQLTAAGGDIEKLIPMIEGIANATAFAGKGATEFSRAIYNLNQSYSAGYLQMMDWRSLELAGVASKQLKEQLISTAEELGKIEKGQITIANFSQTLKDRWADTEVMEQAFGKFAEFTEAVYAQVSSGKASTAYDAIEQLADKYDKVTVEAFKAAQQAKSFSEAIEATKDAVSSGWMRTYEVIFGNIEESKKFWGYLTDTLWEAFASGAQDRNDLLAKTFNSGFTTFKDLAGALDDTGFTNHLKAVNDTFGESIADMIKETGSFEEALRKSLREGTLTTDDLSVALNKLATEYGGLNDRQLKNLGFSPEQIAQLQKFNEEIQNGSLSIDDFANKITRLSGRELLLNSDEAIGELGAIPNILKAIGSLLSPIRDAFNEIFFGITDGDNNLENRAEGLYKLLDGFRKLTKGLILTDSAMDKLKRTFKGIFAVIDIVLYVTAELGKAILGPLLEGTSFLTEGVLGATASIGDFLVALRDAIKGSSGLVSFTTGIGSVLRSIVDVLKTFATSFYSAIRESGFDSVLNFLKTFWNAIKTVVSAIGSVIGGLFNSLGNAINGSGISTILELLTAGALTTAALKIGKVFDSVGSIVDEFTGILDSVKDCLNSFTSSIKAKSLQTIATSMLMLAGSILIIALIDKDTLERSLAAMTLLFVGLMGALTIIGNIGAAVVSSGTILSIGVSLLMMGMVIKQLSSLDWAQMGVGLIAMTGALVALTGVLSVLAVITKKMSIVGTDLDKRGNVAISGAGTLFKIAVALLPAALVLKILGTMNWTEMGVGLISMVTALGAMTGAYAIMAHFSKNSITVIRGAEQLFKISMSLMPLSIALKILSSMGWDGFAVAATAMAAALGYLVISVSLLAIIDKLSSRMKTDGGGLTSILSKCMQVVLIALALNLLVHALDKLSSQPWDKIVKGITIMIGSLFILLKGLKTISEMDQGMSITSVLILLGMVAAIKQLAPALFVLGQYNWETIGKGLTAMLGVMTILVASMKILSSKAMARTSKIELFGQKLGQSEGTPFIRMATSILIMAASIRVLVGSLVLLGQLKWKTILKGLTAMAGIMTILVASLKLIGTASISLTSFAGAIALFGAACLAAGVGISLTLYALSVLGESLSSSIGTICTALYENAPKIGQAFASLVVEFLKAIVSISDQLVKTLAELILNAIHSMTEYLPEFVGAFVELLIGVIDEVVNELPKLAEPIAKLLNGLFGLFDQVMVNVDTSGMKNIALAVGFLSLAMVELSKISWSDIPKAIVGVGGIVIMLGLLATAAGALANKFPDLENTMNSGAGILGALGNCIGAFIGGLLGGIAAGFSGGVSEGNLENMKKMIQSVCSPEVITSLTLIAGLTAVIALLSKIKVNPEDYNSALTKFLGMFMIVSGIAALFAAFSTGNESGTLQAFQTGAAMIQAVCSPEVISSLAMVAALAAAVSVLAKIKVDDGAFGKAVTNLAITIGFITALTGLFAILADSFGQDAFINGINLLKTVCAPDVLLTLGEIGALAVVVTGLAFVLSKLKLNPADIGKAIITMGGIVVFLTAIAGLFGLLALIPGADTFLAKGVNLLKLICDPMVIISLGLAAVLMAVCAALMAIGVYAIAGAALLCLFIAEIGAFLMLAGTLATNPGTKLFEDGIGLLELIFSLRTALVLAAAATVMALIIPLGVLAAAAALSLIPIGLFIVELGAILAGLGKLYQNETVRQLIEDGGNALEAIGKAIGKFIGGVIGGIGEGASNSLATIGDNLSKFMEKSAPFFDGLSKFDKNMKKNVENLADMIKTIVTEIPSLGGIKSWFVGEKDLEVFGNGLTKVGEGIADFAKSVSGEDVNLDNVNKGTESLGKLAEVAKNIPDTANVFETLFGGDKFKDFPTNAKYLGEGIAAFATAISEEGVTFTGVDAAVGAADTIFECIDNMPSSKKFGLIDTVKIKAKLVGIADGIKSFASKTKGITAASVKGAVDAINSVTKSLSKLSANNMDSVVSAFDNSHTKIAKAVQRAIDAGIEVIRDNADSSEWYDSGEDLMDRLADGIEGNSKSVEDETKAVLNKASSIDTTSYNQKFITIGNNLIAGLTSGIRQTGMTAVTAMNSLCASIESAARSALRINSPSKVFYNIGSGCGEGLVNSLNDYQKRTADAGYDMAYSSVKGLGNAMKKVESIIGDGIETQPTIRPVLDLSDVTSGVGTLNKMFDTNPSIGAVSTVNSINRLMNRGQNEASNDDVITAINGLKETISDSSGTVYNFGNVSYGSGSEVQEAVEALVRAILVGGRK